MKDPKRAGILRVSFFLGLVLGTLLLASDVFAAEKISSGRKIWDNIMLFLNFGILVFLFLKYAKKPLMTYLRGVKQDMEENLNDINGQLENAKSHLGEETKRIEDIDQRINEIKENILEMGRREKEHIINQGKIAADKMIKDAEEYAVYKTALARKILSDEMVDMAIDMVEKNLKKGISEEDHDRLISQFVVNLESDKKKTI